MNDQSTALTDLLSQLKQALTLQRGQQVEILAGQILQLDNKEIKAYYALFTLFEVQQRYQHLKDIALQCLQYYQQDALSYYYLALAQRFLHDNLSALSSLAQALTLNPENIQWRNLYGVMLKENGQFKQAQQCFDECIKQNKNVVLSYYNRSTLTALLAAEELSFLEKKYRTSSLTDSDKINIAYTLFRHYEYLKEYSQAFVYLSKASQLKRSNLIYDHQHEINEHQQIAAVFSADFIKQRQLEQLNFTSDNYVLKSKLLASKQASKQAIFICGLPRSGTTLVEQIISSHSQVTAGDELYALAQATQNVFKQCRPQQKFPFAFNEFQPKDFIDVGEQYLQLTKNLQTKAFFTDKMLLNYKALGLIKVALPKAKIVVCQRNAMDLLWGSYKQMLGEGNKYSYDLDELSDVIIAHQRLVQHWQTVFPESIFILKYETLIAQQQTVTKQLLDYFSLPFEQACIDFHTNKRTVHTLSNVQVRQPIFTRGVEQWLKYHKELAPYLQKFKDAGIISS